MSENSMPEPWATGPRPFDLATFPKRPHQVEPIQRKAERRPVYFSTRVTILLAAQKKRVVFVMTLAISNRRTRPSWESAPIRSILTRSLPKNSRCLSRYWQTKITQSPKSMASGSRKTCTGRSRWASSEPRF